MRACLSALNETAESSVVIMSLLSLTSDEGSTENVSSPLLVEIKSQASTSQRSNAQPRATSYKREAVVRKVTSGGMTGYGSIQAATNREGGWYVTIIFSSAVFSPL